VVDVGEFDKHVKLAKEKAKMAEVARSMNCYSAMCDLAFKAVEQAVQAELATIGSKGVHYKEHEKILDWVNKHYPKEMAARFSDLWRLYLDVGYSGTTPIGVPERIYNHMKSLLSFIGRRINVDFGV